MNGHVKVTVTVKKRKINCTVLLSILLPHRDHTPYIINGEWSRWGKKIERSIVFIRSIFQNGLAGG